MGLCATVASFADGSRWLDGWRLPLVLLLLSQVPAIDPTLHRPDGFEYYVLARSPLFDHDLDLANDYRLLGTYGQYSSTGDAVSRTPYGLAVLWTPAIVLAHLGTLVARVFGADVAADGCTAPYQAAVTFASFCFGAAALLLTEGFVRRRHGPAIALLVAFALWAATPVAFYSVLAPSSSHPASMLMVGGFLLLWLRNRDRTGLRDWVLVGALGGLMAVVRIQDCVFLALPVLDQILTHRPGFIRRLAAMLAAPALFGLLQAAVWMRLWGFDFMSEVADRSAFRGHLHVMDVLLSPRHGVFTWTPVWLLAFLGWLLGLRREIRLALPALTALALLVLVNASLDDWAGSIAFGHRRFLGLTLFFGMGLAWLFELLGQRPLLTVAAVVAALALWNQQFTVIFAKRMVAGRDAPVTLDRLAGAQVDVFFREWVAAEERLPWWIFAVGYDNLKDIWLDEGRSMEGRVDLTVEDRDQPLPFIIGEGWLAPQQRDGVGSRRSRGWASSLRVPIRTPGAFRLFLRARSMLPDHEVGVALTVNGTPVGEASAGREWRDLRYEVPSSAVRRGFNTLVFSYGTTMRTLDPAHRGLNSAVAVQDLRFERRP
jgi:hypothetical protein